MRDALYKRRWRLLVGLGLALWPRRLQAGNGDGSFSTATRR